METADPLGLRAIDKFRSGRTSTLYIHHGGTGEGACRLHVQRCGSASDARMNGPSACRASRPCRPGSAVAPNSATITHSRLRGAGAVSGAVLAIARVIV